MKILITGAGGFIGRGLTTLLAQQGHEIIALDDDSRGSLKLLPAQTGVTCVHGDVLDCAQMQQVTRGVDAIYHLAYINGTKYFYSIPDRILEVGIIGTHNILKAALGNKVPRFYLASSSEVYQQAAVIPTPEEVDCKIPDVLNPRYSYGGGKIACELLTINYLRNSAVQWGIFRPHNVYGPAMGHEHVLPNLIDKIFTAKSRTRANKLDIEIQGQGLETRSFIYIDDAARAIDLCTLHNADGGIFHIGTMEEITIRHLVELIADIVGVTVHIRTSPSPAGGTPRRCPETSKLQALGFQPAVSLRKGVEQTVKWYWDYYAQAAAMADRKVAP